MDFFLTYIDKGGIIFSFLFFLSIITLAIVIYKYLEIYFFKSLDFDKLIEIINEANQKITLKEVEENFISLVPRSSRNLLKQILNLLNENKPKQEIEEEINSIVDIEFNKQQSLLPSLEIISQVSPLIGLLGTVIGMIDSFNELELGGSLVDPSILAGGIWTALLTTAMGLIVAIPALVSHYFLEKKINKHSLNIDLLFRKLIAIQ
ncbi:MAG: hypothetical protein CBC25_03785 [Pelagibacteraceae bacterium TMED65]|nr:hypothetical protein [Rickettsiales bacterium]OUU52164.1 MAG: hypothetical protein CBC25_03785 [Pelagibacteraceae bacterium TMED65]|tara:strand:- start:30 stop:647 length:618 start_codon:yes stop_codon:yes gene_type:complete